MQKRARLLPSLLVAVLLTASAIAQTAAATHPIHFRVTLDSAATSKPVSGRLIVFMSKKAPQHDVLQPGFGADAHKTWIAAEEVSDWKPGTAVEVNPDRIAYPAPFSKAPAGDYWVMAFLDHNHNAAYTTFDAGDLGGKAVKFKKVDLSAGKPIELQISEVVPARQITLPENSEMIDFVSPVLTAFWGRAIHMRAVVVLPPSYAKGDQRYPTVYMTHGYTADINTLAGPYTHSYAEGLKSGRLPEMIYVLLDESCPGGTHEFADSVNNGPWGRALTAELIPHLEQKYRMDATAQGRFLTGHSSGGWATLWLQVAYPKIFGGTWSTSPDPVTFRDFTGPDITKPEANVYRKPDGSRWMLMREGDKDVESLQDFAQEEEVLGQYGGQMHSFEWVFSPRAADGTPMEMFDRKTGVVNPDVAKYWVNNYDITNIVRTRWTEIGPDLKGKIHVIVGTLDTFHLDGPARKLDAALKELGADATFTYLEGRSHFDLYQGGLDEKIAKEMYAVARPKSAAATQK